MSSGTKRPEALVHMGGSGATAGRSEDLHLPRPQLREMRVNAVGLATSSQGWWATRLPPVSVSLVLVLRATLL